MKTLWTFLLLAILFAALSEALRSRNNRFRSYTSRGRSRYSRISSPSRLIWNRYSPLRRFFNPFRRRYSNGWKPFKPYQPKRIFKPFLSIHRQALLIYDEKYGAWSNWTSCSPKTCTIKRRRKCLDNSWKFKISEYSTKPTCLFKYILESKPCNDTETCADDKTISNATDSYNSFQSKCGIRPRASKPTISTKIVGGKKAKPNSWPFHANIFTKKCTFSRCTFVRLCGGTLVAPNWVVTAGHCLTAIKSRIPPGKMIKADSGKLKYLYVRLGENKISDRTEKFEEEIRGTHLIVHPKMIIQERMNIYDVGLIKLAKPAQPNIKVDYACVDKNVTFPVGTRCFAIGYGFKNKIQEESPVWREFDLFPPLDSGSSRRELSEQLMEVDIPIQDLNVCKHQFYYTIISKKAHICAGSPGKDSCKGDSGGGLYCQDNDNGRWYLNGIISFGSTRGCGVNNGVYTRVAGIYDWMKKSMEMPLA